MRTSSSVVIASIAACTIPRLSVTAAGSLITHQLKGSRSRATPADRDSRVSADEAYF
jgi:hypothetical protein